MLLKTLIIAACAAMLVASHAQIVHAQAVEATTNAQPKTWGPAGKIGEWTTGQSLGFVEFQRKHPECEILAINNMMQWVGGRMMFWTAVFFIQSAKCPATSSN